MLDVEFVYLVLRDVWDKKVKKVKFYKISCFIGIWDLVNILFFLK